MPNRTVPEFWKDDLTLNTLPRAARLLFYLIHHVITDEHRFKIGPSPQRPLLLHAALFALDPGQRCTDTSRDLLRLKEAGVISLQNDSERGWYGEIAERLWYRAEDFAKGAPRLGPRQAKPIAQPELRLGVIGECPPVPKRAMESKPYESGNGYDHESPAAAGKMIRAQSRGEEEDSEKRARGTFSIPRDAVDDALWHRLWDACGAEEMRASGSAWMRRFSLERETVVTVLSDMESSPQKIVNTAAWLNAAYMKSPAGLREAHRKGRAA